MSLTHNVPIGFIPTTKAEEAKAFYRDVLGLTFVSDDEYAMIFLVGPEPEGMLRIVRMPAYTPAQYTIYGWEVDDIHAKVAELKSRGVEFIRFSFFDQDEHGVWRAPGGSSVAWFRDPDGNTLSISHHPE